MQSEDVLKQNAVQHKWHSKRFVTVLLMQFTRQHSGIGTGYPNAVAATRPETRDAAATHTFTMIEDFCLST